MRTTEPTEIFQGETVEWTKSFTDYSPSDYTLVYYLRGVGKGADITATTSGEDFLASVSSAVTETLAVGKYKLQSWLIAGSEKIFREEKTVEIKAGFLNLDSAQSIDTRSQTEKDLEAVRTSIRALMTGGTVQEYSIGNRSLKRMPIADLMSYEKSLVKQLNQERLNERRRNGGRLIKTRLISHSSGQNNYD